MKKAVFLLSAILLLISTSASAFDGLRKGFVLGGGLGFTPNAQWKVSNSNEEYNKVGAGMHVIIGYAWDEKNMLVYEGNVSGYIFDTSPLNDVSTNIEVVQGFNGGSWYHYFGEMGKSFFTVTGIGFYILTVEDHDADPGFGLLAGAGYEFTRHFQVAGYFSYGKTSNYIYDHEHTHISVLVSAVAF